MLHAAASLCPPASSASQEETVMDPRSLFIAGDRPTLALLSPLGGRPPQPVALRAHMWLCSWRSAGKREGKGSGRASEESNPRGSGERIRSEEAERYRGWAEDHPPPSWGGKLQEFWPASLLFLSFWLLTWLGARIPPLVMVLSSFR